MPILDTLQDFLAKTKGRYERYVGRCTRAFCKNADRRSKTRIQRKVWLTAAISVDEVIASWTGLEKRRPVGPLSEWTVNPGAGRKDYVEAMRVYLSGLLLLCGAMKQELLDALGYTEQEFMQTWQDIFEYEAPDKAFFDDVLTPAFREGGIDGLVQAVGQRIRELLFLPDSVFGKPQSAALQDLMIDDVSATRRHLAGRDEDPAGSKRG